MRIFARYNLVHDDGSPDDELLLEGSWPAEERRFGRWSLDEAIDARFAWLDPLAMELAQRAGGTSPALSFAYINALALRYYLVKLLRVVAFFHHVRPDAAGRGGYRAPSRPPLIYRPGDSARSERQNSRRVVFHAAPGDEDYADLLRQLAAAHGQELIVRWQPESSSVPVAARRPAVWRKWAARALPASRPGGRSTQPRVVLCGNPHILNPVCAELLARQARIDWLYERFAARCWCRWRAAGVEQLLCETGRRARSAFNDVSSAATLVADGIDLTRPVDRWLAQRALEMGRHQSLWVERIESHFRRVRPRALIVDEDATPLKRIAVALARGHGAASMVVQHGAACGPFGFLPLAADKIAVWGVAAHRQLKNWGLPSPRILIAGWPARRAAKKRAPQAQSQAKRFLLLATMPPRDERPDNVEFHLTSANYRDMLETTCRVLSTIDGATLVVKLHPRDASAFGSPASSCGVCACDGKLPVKVVRSANLSKLIAASDCVLSCASTAGIEAALAGAPVIQLLPAGSGDILPADDWGFVGSARTEAELAQLVEQAMARGWRHEPPQAANMVAAQGRDAAARIVDGVFEEASLLEVRPMVTGKA